MDFLLYPFVGFLAGIVVGISGMGGAALMTPILIISGIPAQMAITTDLLFAAVTKSFNIGLQKKTLIINKKILACMIFGSVSGMIITSQFLKKYLVKIKDINFLLTISLACILIATALSLIVLTWVQRNKATDPLDISAAYTSIPTTKLFLTFLVAVFIGGSVFLTSVGSGVLGVVALLWLYPKLPIRQVVSIDICYAIPLTLLSWLSLLFFSEQTSDYPLLLQLLVGSTIGTLVSIPLLKRLNERVIRFLMIILILITSIKLFHKAFT